MKGRSELYREAMDAESVAFRAIDTLSDRIAEPERERDQLRYERDILMAERALTGGKLATACRLYSALSDVLRSIPHHEHDDNLTEVVAYAESVLLEWHIRGKAGGRGRRENEVGV